MKSPLALISSHPFLFRSVAAAILLGAPAAEAAYPDLILSEHPLAYYRLEETEGTTLTDSTGNGFTGTYKPDSGGQYPLLGQPGIDTNSISLHPTSSTDGSYASAGWFAEFNQAGPFAVEAWARPTTIPASGEYRCPVGNFGGWSSGYPGWMIYQTPGPGPADSRFQFAIPSANVWIVTTTPYIVSTWYHFVGSYDGTNASFYVNGELIGTQAGAGPYLPNPWTPLAIGHRGEYNMYWDGKVDEVAIYTNALSAASILAHYELGTNSFRTLPPKPTISQNPASTTAYAGHAVQFNVLAEGPAPLKYQWYRSAASISGATTTALSFVCAVADDGVGYSAVVTNNSGSVTSATATLTVSTGLLIDAQPTAITRRAGSTAAFQVVAEGALPLSYQWYKGPDPIQGATNQTLWLNNIALSDDQSSYYAQVSTPYASSSDSDSAILTVVARTAYAPTNLYSKLVGLDAPVAYWRLDETTGPTALDAVGSFDGTYDDNAGAGTFTFGVTNGIPYGTDAAAVGLAGGARVTIPYALELNPWGPFSAEGWFKPASLAANSSDYRAALSSLYNPYGTAGPTGWLLYQMNDNTWAWFVYGGLWNTTFIYTTEAITAGQWYDIALTYDGVTFTIFVNGTAKASATYSGFIQNGNVPSGGSGTYNYNYMGTGSGPANIGWRSDNNFNPFVGNVDEVAFYDKALSPQQIQNHYLAGVRRLTITRSGSDIVLSWPFGTLQQADQAGGPYTSVLGVTSPYTNAPAAAAKFYRFEAQ